MEQGAYQGKDDYYVMPLPLRESTPKMPNNRSLALYRLSKLQTRLENDENHRKDYNAFINDLYAKGYAEQVPKEGYTAAVGTFRTTEFKPSEA